MTQSINPPVAELRLKADTPAEHWADSDRLGAGVSRANVQFEDITFEDVEGE